MIQCKEDTGQLLDSMRDELAAEIVDRHYDLHPELSVRYGAHGRKKCTEDAAYHLKYLAESLRAAKPHLFKEYVAWAKVMLAARGIPARDLANNLQIIIRVLNHRLPPEEATVACHYIEAAMTALPQMAATVPAFLTPNLPLAELAQSYLTALLACERNVASRLILDAVAAGTTIKDIYLHVFQQSQWEIGRLWQINEITVAQEHYCSAATQMIMSQLYPQIFAGPRIGRKFVGACVGGDLHEIGIRMVADFFEMDGWDTVYLGASLPGPDFVRTLVDRQPHVVGISATITPHISAVAQAISEIRATSGCDNIKIIVGGRPFSATPDLWKQVNADGTSSDAQGAVDLATQLTRK